MKYNYRLLLILAILCIISMLAASCKSSKSSCDAYGFEWKKKGADSLSIVKDNSLFLPYIPLMGATSFHMNDPNPGNYTVFLKHGDSVIEEKSFLLK
jgi:hypothetical protein